MSFAVTACASLDELRAALVPMGQYLGFNPSEEFVAQLSRIMPPERVLAARSGEAVVGGAASYAFELSIPGGRLTASGLSYVAVAPTHRRQGILSAMMRIHLDAAHARGEPLAYLWASEDMIYGRFGFGLAAQMADIDLARSHARLHADARRLGAIRLVPSASAEDAVSAIYQRVFKTTPGMFARSPAWWQTRLLTDHEWRRRGGGPQQCAILEAPDGPAAYAFYRLNAMFDRGVNEGAVAVIEAMGVSPAATEAIWRYLLEIDWLAKIKAWRLPLDHPLHLLLTEPRRMNFTVRDGVWLRLVDVERALASRSYAASDSIVVEITDAFCPWNAGRWTIGQGGARRTDALPELGCDVSALGSAYLGGFSWSRLAAASRVAELRPGAIERADALFHTLQLPWCPEIF